MRTLYNSHLKIARDLSSLPLSVVLISFQPLALGSNSSFHCQNHQTNPCWGSFNNWPRVCWLSHPLFSLDVEFFNIRKCINGWWEIHQCMKSQYFSFSSIQIIKIGLVSCLTEFLWTLLSDLRSKSSKMRNLRRWKSTTCTKNIAKPSKTSMKSSIQSMAMRKWNWRLFETVVILFYSEFVLT